MIKYQLKRIMSKFFYPKPEIDELLTDKETIEISKNQISDFPASIPAAAHTHNKSEITDFPSKMDPTAHTHKKSEITDFPATMTPTAHNHGNLNDDGLLNSDVSSNNVSKMVVTDSTQNLKTINKIPFSKLDISKNNLVALGLPGADTNTTYSAGTGLTLNDTTFNIHNAPATELRHTITAEADFSNINKTALPVGVEIAQNAINELIDHRLGELFASTGDISTTTIKGSNMQPGRYTDDSWIRWTRIGRLVVMDYHLQGNSSLARATTLHVCNVPDGYLPNNSNIYSNWTNTTSNGQIRMANNPAQVKLYIVGGNTSNVIAGQLIYFIGE